MKDSFEEELVEVDKQVLKVFDKCDTPPSTYEIAKKANMSWSTANSHLYKLKAMGLIKGASGKSKSGTGRKMVWWASGKPY
ncbi:MAG: winged helix-turn-helix domain-containing protein [Candidatus Altiarchaeota archaeon]